MAAGDITWFRYARHDGIEQKVGADDATLPAHHSHYSFLQKVKNPYFGSSLEDFLEAEGLTELLDVNIETLLGERGKTHGDFRENARLMQFLKAVFRSEAGWERLSDTQRESLDMIALKIGRILTGDATEPDHWLDVAGYAKLGGERHRP